MEEFIQGMSRLELLKRGALGRCRDRRCRRTARAARRPERRCSAPKPGGKLVVGIGQDVRGHQRADRVRLPLGPADGLRDVRHARQVRQRTGTRGAAARGEAGRRRTRRRRSSRSGRASSSTTATRCGSRTSSGASTASTTRSSRRRTTSSPSRRTSGARPSRSTTRRFKITTKKPARMVESWRFWFIMPENADDLEARRDQPIGTGPVPVQELRQGRPARADAVRGLLERQPSRTSTSLTFRFLADESAQVANFLSGDVSYLHDISVATLPQVQGKRNSKLIPSGIFFQWWQPQMYFGPLEGRERPPGPPVGVRQGHRQQGRVGRAAPSRPGTRSRRAPTRSGRRGRAGAVPTPRRRRACSPRRGART